MLQHRNHRMEEDIIHLLKIFYHTVIASHSRKVEKKQVLELFFSRIHLAPKTNVSIANPKGKHQHESLTTIADGDNWHLTPRTPLAFASNIHHNNFLSSYTNRSQLNQTRPEIKTAPSFTTTSIYKVLSYALWTNFIQIQKIASFLSPCDHLAYSQQLAAEGIQKMKRAKQQALNWLKGVDRRKHAKNYYLYKQLLACTLRDSPVKLEYLRIAIEEFDNEYLAKAFEYLWQEESVLIYSRSIVEGSSFEVQFSGLIMVGEVNKSLQSLNAQMMLLEEGGETEAHCGRNLIIVVEELSGGMFKLREVITFHDTQ